MTTLHRARGLFVGRDDELADLAELIGLDAQATPGSVVVAGDAGVGKTRLLAAVHERAEAAGWRVLVGHCVGLDGSDLPYLPFREALGQLMDGGPDGASALTDIHSGLIRLLASGAQDPHGDSLARPERGDVFQAVHSALEDAARAGPLLVIIEDVHWADPSTRELLSFLFTRGFTSPLSIIVSYRSDDLHRRHPLRATAAEWARLPGVERVQLRPLQESHVRALVGQLRDRPLRESDMRAIVERAEGNAFYAEELVVAAERGGPSLPDNLADLLLVRLDQLDGDSRHVVRAASVAGRRVSHDLLADVAELDAAALDVAIRAAVEASVLVTDGTHYAFRHALLSEAVYDDLLPGERVRLHARYTRALQRTSTTGAAAELARHARAANELVTALHASIRAGDEAMAVGGPDEAAHHYEVALELLPDAGDVPTDGPHSGAGGDAEHRSVDRIDVAVKASEAMIAAGRTHRAPALLHDMLKRLPDDTPVPDRGRLLHALAGAALVEDGFIDALEVTNEALSLLPPEPETPLRARLLSVHALANAYRQRDEDASRWANEALRVGQRLGLTDVVASATTTLARLEERAGNPAMSITAFTQVVERARETGDLTAELRGLHHIAGVHYESGELGQALTFYTAAMERAAEFGRPWAPYGLDARVLAGITAYVRGDWPQALAIVDVTGKSPPANAEALMAAVGLQVAAGRGDPAAIRLLPEVRSWWERDGMIASVAGGAAIDLHGDRGDLAAARAAYADVVETLGRMWQGRFLAEVRLSALMLGQLAAQASATPAAQHGDLSREAASLVTTAERAIESSAQRKRAVGIEGQAWMSRVTAERQRLEWLIGSQPPDYKSLVDAWQLAISQFRQFGHAFEVARSQARLAAVMRAGGQVAEARVLIEAAREVARRLDAAPLLAEVGHIGSVGSRDRPDDSRTNETLTAREHEILALVAQGRSNAEIGRQLFISTKTVSVHVSNILAKLGASGRTEAASLARGRGLLS
ncbi:MAG TPA: AAA family ATPase [Nocardioidaceae bacterium]|nr:AAA family ATPase [Nocardioidaceae bacterium]